MVAVASKRRQIVHHDAKPFQGSDTQQCHVTRLGEDDFVVGFEALGAQNRVPGFSLNPLLSGGGECRACAAG